MFTGTGSFWLYWFILQQELQEWKKGVETRRLDSLMGWEQLESKDPSPSVSFCCFLLLEHWVAVLCLDQVMKVHVLHF